MYGVQVAIWSVLRWYFFQDVMTNFLFTINNYNNMIVSFFKKNITCVTKKSNTNIYNTKNKIKNNIKLLNF